MNSAPLGELYSSVNRLLEPVKHAHGQTSPTPLTEPDGSIISGSKLVARDTRSHMATSSLAAPR
jgi:hypothetical protein